MRLDFRYKYRGKVGGGGGGLIFGGLMLFGIQRCDRKFLSTLGKGGGGGEKLKKFKDNSSKLTVYVRC